MFKVIVWATDGSPAAGAALPFVKQLAETNGSRIVVIHVDEVAGGLGGPYELRANEDELRTEVETIVQKLQDDGISVDAVYRKAAHGGTAQIIVQAAKDADADLIVAGTRGLGTIAGLLLGSVTHRLVHIAPCPVMVVPSPR